MVLGANIRMLIVRFSALFYSSKKSKVIFYHDIHSSTQYTDMSTPIDLFVKHINIIRKNGFEIVSEITKSNGQIEICFDDGFLGLYDNIELIKRLNIPIHLFIVSSFLDKEHYIDQEKLIILNNLSQITISSHTHTHQVLNIISEKNIFVEFQKSKRILEKVLGTEIKSICFPEGKFSKQILELANKVGYKKQYSSIPGFYWIKEHQPFICRSLVQFSKEDEFKAILKGGDHILSFWYKMKHFKK